MMTVTIYLNLPLTIVTARAPQVVVPIAQQRVSLTDTLPVATTVNDHRPVLTIPTALVKSNSTTAVLKSLLP